MQTLYKLTAYNEFGNIHFSIQTKSKDLIIETMIGRENLTFKLEIIE
jgi:uncharacterized protein YjfI (DUF2170 family)